MSKKIIRGFRTNMTLYSLCLIAFVAVTVPFQPLLAAAGVYIGGSQFARAGGGPSGHSGGPPP